MLCGGMGAFVYDIHFFFCCVPLGIATNEGYLRNYVEKGSFSIVTGRSGVDIVFLFKNKISTRYGVAIIPHNMKNKPTKLQQVRGALSAFFLRATHQGER